MSDSNTVTYGSYLQIDALLQLQKPLSEPEEHDELLFITIHQVYELWFKQMLHELDTLQNALRRNQDGPALALFKRILTILKTLVAQVDVLETMTPISFGAFRERLQSASGFQSVQFREVEFILGHKRAQILERPSLSETERKTLQKRFEQPTLYDACNHYLAARGYAVPSELLHRPVQQPIEPNAALQKTLLEVYRGPDAIAQAVCERMLDIDEGIQEWRYRHVKMVERTIGTKIGTGGSSGAGYLKQTLFQPLWPDLWAVRHQM